jgi:hypothetical protein
MMNEELQSLIAEHREQAAQAGDAARDAMLRGDIGLARTAARQAAQWARIVIQLETGEKQSAPDTGALQTDALDSGKIM